MRNARRLEGCSGKPGADCRCGKSQRKSDRMPSRPDRDRNTAETEYRSSPPSGFAIGGEISHDTEAESDRQPRHQPPRGDLGQYPSRQQTAELICSTGKALGQQQASGRPGGVDTRGPAWAPSSSPRLGAGTVTSILGTLAGQGAVRLPTPPLQPERY